MRDFEVAFERTECQQSSIMKLNYALTMADVVKNGGNEVLVCQAVELFIDVQGDQSIPANLLEVATDKATKFMTRCRKVSAQMTEAEFQAASRRAIEHGKAGRREQAILSWRALVRIRNDRVEPQRALCRLLRKTDRKDEAERRCAAWRFLVGQKNENSVDVGGDYPIWPLAAISGGFLAAAGLTYALASSTHSDLLAANRRAVEAAEQGERGRYDQANKEQENLTSKMHDLQATTWIFLGSGIVCGGIATYLWSDAETIEFAWTGPSLEWRVRW